MSLIRIDESHLKEHCYLTDEDECYYFGEYISGGGYQAAPINQLIFNFKKPVDRKGTLEYEYKTKAINAVADLLRNEINEEVIKACTFVPIPPSKAKSDPLYDDRLLQSLRLVNQGIDVRELILLSLSCKPHHEHTFGERRPTPQQLLNLYTINESEAQTPVKPTIVLFDDILTTGSHFVACKNLLNERFPTANIIGLFIGRANHAAAD